MDRHALLSDPNMRLIIPLAVIAVILVIVVLYKVMTGQGGGGGGGQYRQKQGDWQRQKGQKRGNYRAARDDEPRLVWELINEPPVALEGSITIGRSDSDERWMPDVDLTDPDMDPQPLVSRHHARIVTEGGRFVIEDLNSTNSTRVNEDRLPSRGRMPLTDGARVVIRPYVFTFREGGREANEMWGDFEVSRLIARGGMSEVHYAINRVAGNTNCALKVPIDDYGESQAEAAMRMEREGEYLMRLARAGRHPHIVNLFAAGKLPPNCRCANKFFLALELIRGGDLRERLTGRPMKENEVRVLTTQVCSALSQVHGCGLVHCDLKPENILFAEAMKVPVESNTAKLVDFGISVPLGSTEFNAWGEESYMSPEHLGAGTLTAQADLYSLGCILYELLAVDTPYVGDSDTIKRKHMNPTVMPEPVSVAARRKGNNVSKEMDDLVMALLQKNPRDRPRSAQDVAAGLQGGRR